MELNKYGLHQIELDVVEGCNLQCDFCGLAGMKRAVHYMSIETVDKVCDLIHNSGLSLRIHLIGHGEPTLHPQISHIIQHIRKRLPKSKLTMTTNGFSILRSEDPVVQIKEYFDSGLDTLTIDEYLHNDLSHLRAYLQEKGIPFSENITDSFAVAERLRINPPIETNVIRKLSCRCGSALEPEKSPLNLKCSKIFRELFIRWDGNVGLCCEDFRGEYAITNVHTASTLAEVWNHPRLESARRLLYKGERSFHPCSACNVKPNRPGLLPDWTGKSTVAEPQEQDRLTVSYRSEPLSEIVRREWENEHNN